MAYQKLDFVSRGAGFVQIGTQRHTLLGSGDVFISPSPCQAIRGLGLSLQLRLLRSLRAKSSAMTTQRQQ